MPTVKITSWVLMLDSKKARILSRNKNGRLEDLGYEIGSEEVRTDSPSTRHDLGRSYDSVGGGRHIIEPPTSDATQQRMAFAHIVSRFLDTSLKEGKYERLIIIAPQKMLGILRKDMSDAVRDVVDLEIDKNLMQVPIDEVQEQIEEISHI